MTSTKPSSSVLDRVSRIIRAELANYPGRVPLVARIVLACTSVMVLVMVFRIPAASLGAYYPLLISRDSLQATRQSAFRICLTCTLGAAVMILGGVLTAGSPFLQFLWVLLNLLGVFYLIDTLKFPDAPMALAPLIAQGLKVWDDPVSGERRVEHTLYLLLTILIACVASVIIETLFAKKHPPDAVLSSIRLRLGLVRDFLESCGKSEPKPEALGIQLSRYATRGVGDVRQLLQQANYEALYKQRFSSVIALTGQLVESALAAAEASSTFSPMDISHCAVLAGRVESIGKSLEMEKAPDWLELSPQMEAGSPILVEMERTIDLISQCFNQDDLPFHHQLHLQQTAPSKGIFVENAFRTNEHFKFALRGTLSALFCYLFYMSTGWMALRNCIGTCFVTAFPSRGASRLRLILRFAGFILGAGVIGLGVQVLILPQIDELLGYTLLFASIVTIGAWVATSGPRIAYCGFQLVFAYDQVNLNKFTLNTSLVPARDTILGIVLGIAGMWLFFDHLWAKSSSVSMRSLLLATLGDIARLDGVAGESSGAANQQLIDDSTRINRNLDKLRSLSDLYAFESFPKTREETFLNRFVIGLLPQVRAFLLVKTGLLQHVLVGESVRDNNLVIEVQRRSSEILLGVTNSVERLSPAVRDTRLSIQELRNRLKEGISRTLEEGERRAITEMRLCSSLLELALHVEAGVQADLEAA